MAQQNLLWKGVPFFFLLGAGTYVLSLFSQVKYDAVVRVPCSISPFERAERPVLVPSGALAGLAACTVEWCLAHGKPKLVQFHVPGTT